MKKYKIAKCPCDKPMHIKGFIYLKPPRGETTFNYKKTKYYRSYKKCKNCGHWFTDVKIKFKNFYKGDYVKATYGKQLKQAFKKVLSLPKNHSDNYGRVKRVVKYTKTLFPESGYQKLLDIGSGLAVFPFRMQEKGFDVTALDPDAQAVEHARGNAGLRAIHKDFLKWKPSKNKRYDIITINKVLEHLENPIDMLLKAKKLIKPQGFLYLEVPDAAAAALGKHRQEFFIEHLHVFSKKSLAYMLKKSGWRIDKISKVQEPSGKLSINAFALCGGKPC